MRSFQCLLLATVACIAAGQSSHTTPVPILKQINKQNDDGSYSFGYEAADGSYKIETKYPTGDVAGKYGYVDDSGNLREVEYGASSKRGFEPQGSGINVPPPTLNDPSNALQPGDEDDGQYREDPSIYEKDPKYSYPKTHAQSSRRPATTVFQQSYQPQEYQQPAVQQYQQPAIQRYQQPAVQQYKQPSVQRYQQPAQQKYQQPAIQQYQQPAIQQYQQPAPQQYQQSVLPQARQFPSPLGGSRIYHNQPEFSYQQFQPYQEQAYQQPHYNSFPAQQYVQYPGHPAQNLDLDSGSYSINYSG